MKSLYIANITLRTTHYMAVEATYANTTRIIWAESDDEARGILARALEVDDPYSSNTTIDSIEINEALGTP